MLRIGIRDYLVRVEPILFNDFIEIYEDDDSKITDYESAKKYIGQTVACFRFTESGLLYKKFLATLLDIKPVFDINFKKDSWEIEIKILREFMIH